MLKTWIPVRRRTNPPWRTFAAVTFFLGATGCKVEPPKPPLVETVAVLPFDNESNDVNASDIMQTLVVAALKPSVYRVIDIKEVNEKLEKVGIIDGGQLAAVDPVKLGKDLGVQALMYGDVEKFGYINLGFYQQKKVVLALKLVEVTSGQTLWENTGSRFTPKFAADTNQAQKEFAKGLAEQMVDKLFKSPLQEEAEGATISALSKLPGFSFHGFAQLEGSLSQNKRSGRDAIKSLIHPK